MPFHKRELIHVFYRLQRKTLEVMEATKATKEEAAVDLAEAVEVTKFEILFHIY